MADFMDEVLEDLAGGVSGADEDEMLDDLVGELVDVGEIDEVGAAKILQAPSYLAKRNAVKRLMRRAKRRIPRGAGNLPSPPFGRSARDTERRAPLGFTEDSTGSFFFTLAAVIGATTTMRAKVSRAAHPDRLLIVPSAPGAVLQSIQVGDEEQLLAPGAPVELYSTAALTDTKPDNFSPIGPALDFVVVLYNTTAVAITGTIGIKAVVKR